MRHNVALGAGLAAGAAALALVVSPQVAGAVGSVSSTAGSAVCTTTGRWCHTASPGAGTGYGMGGQMMGGRRGTSDGIAATAPGAMTGRNGGAMMSATGLGTGTLTADQRSTVAAMAEEEKLAHDVYTALAARYPSDARFARIASSESQHLAALRQVMTAYGITDPTAGLADGRFATSSVQQLYSDLLAEATTFDAALAVGRTVETKDIADLDAAMAWVTTAPDVDTVYSHLRMASTMHLRAFGG